MGRRLIESVKGHSGKHLKFHLFKDSLETKHKMVTLDDLKIIGNGYKRSKFRRKFLNLLALINPIFYYYVYILPMVTGLFSDITVILIANFITLKYGCLESTIKIFVLQ